MSDPRARLEPLWQSVLVVSFGAATSGFVLFFGKDGTPLVDVLLMSASLGTLVTAGLWLWLVAARLSRNWAVAFALTFWIPYVNFVVASLFARRYWEKGARAPALLAILGMIGQTLATLRLFVPDLRAPV